MVDEENGLGEGSIIEVDERAVRNFLLLSERSMGIARMVLDVVCVSNLVDIVVGYLRALRAAVCCFNRGYR